jgi:hypothetical protein
MFADDRAVLADHEAIGIGLDLDRWADVDPEAKRHAVAALARRQPSRRQPRRAPF